MKFLPGPSTWENFVRADVGGNNAALVTLDASGVTICQADLGTVILDDVMFVSVKVRLTKGLAAGLYQFQVEKLSGVGVVQFSDFATETRFDTESIPASAIRTYSFTYHFRVVTSGTLVMRLKGLVTASDATVAITEGTMRCIVLRGR